MPSPFPGMDPYLEGDDWTSFHTYLATEIARQLTPLLRPKYIALPEKRFDLIDQETFAIESIYPDVAVAGVDLKGSDHADGPIIAAPYLMATIMDESVPHTWVEIRDTGRRQLITTIEILSPGNKRGRGREEYLDKRNRLLRSPSHLVEIDLLRRGSRLPMKDKLPPGAYYIFVSRAESRPMVQVWPVALQDSLPTIPVPLIVGDADVPLDLQAAINTVYDLSGFDLVLDYSQPPPPTLSADQAAWVATRVQTKQ
ncbi:MAG: uncharacterized protein JWM11_3774 [Planctomycetaceae bacterium]|nr:uncharacterized protein [Planctomycetaceae bacterium]